MTRVLVFELLCAGGASAAVDLLQQGLAMRHAMAVDLLRMARGAGNPGTPQRGIPGQPGTNGIAVHVACSEDDAGGAGPATLPPGALPCPVPSGTDPVRWLAAQAVRFDHVWAVAPETDGLLAACCAAVPPPRWLGCEPAAIALCSRKGATLARLAAHGLPTPWALAAQARRWVTKPDDGAGAVATQVHDRLAAAHATTCRGEPGMTTLEPWVEGEPMSLSLLCDGGRCELLAVNRQHIALDDQGFVHFEGVDTAVFGPDDARWPGLAWLADRIAQVIPGLRGFVGVDFVWPAADTGAPGRPVVIEVNPRLTSAFVGLAARWTLQGRSLAAELLASRRLAHAA